MSDNISVASKANSVIPHTIDRSINLQRWTFEFVFLIILSMLISGVLYLLQISIHSKLFNDPDYILFDFIRALRMLLVYVFLPLIFLYRHGNSSKNLQLLPHNGYVSVNLIGGILIYSVAGFVFIKYEIFFAGWEKLDVSTVFVKFIFIATMASITDLWTRGFILFQLAEKYNDTIAISAQNIIWLIIHIYEIDLLLNYVNFTIALGLTLFLGIAGDILAIRTRSIFGLMIGHVFLNLLIILGARSVI